MVALLERAPRTKARPRLVGGGRAGGGGSRGDGGPDPRREWPLVPAVLLAVLLAALLTWLGMYTQIQANLAGSQLPGA